jgi:pyridoxine 5-phosphate synthase
MEVAAVEEMAKIALDLKPHAVCLVPERREERTTEGGLDAAGLHNQIASIVRELAENGSRVSLFIESLPHQITASQKCGAQVVEFHTGAYALALDEGDLEKAEQLLQQLKDGAKQAVDLGLEVHFGHGLTFDNIEVIAAIPEAMELNIGHFIIGEAIFTGLPAALGEMRNRIEHARASIS